MIAIEPPPQSRSVNVADGAAPFAAWRARQKFPGLRKVVAAAIAAEGPDCARLAGQAEALKSQLAKADPVSIERLQLQRSLDTVTQVSIHASGVAAGKSAKVWRDPKNIELLHRDVVALEEAAAAQMEKIIGAVTDLYRRENWGSVDAAMIAGSTPFHMAIADFREKHIKPCLGKLSGMLNGGTIGDPADASWVLAGCGWRSVKP
jgi:hypothetical protein